jgi:hypothetical protein
MMQKPPSSMHFEAPCRFPLEVTSVHDGKHDKRRHRGMLLSLRGSHFSRLFVIITGQEADDERLLHSPRHQMTTHMK